VLSRRLASIVSLERSAHATQYITARFGGVRLGLRGTSQQQQQSRQEQAQQILGLVKHGDLAFKSFELKVFDKNRVNGRAIRRTGHSRSTQRMGLQSTSLAARRLCAFVRTGDGGEHIHHRDPEPRHVGHPGDHQHDGTHLSEESAWERALDGDPQCPSVMRSPLDRNGKPAHSPQARFACCSSCAPFESLPGTSSPVIRSSIRFSSE